MRKPTGKKLTLNATTIARLDEAELRGAAGGTSFDPCATWCLCTLRKLTRTLLPG
jgi:hypothetical protein